MTEYALLNGKRVLAVDDEPDVLEVLKELLYMCKLTKATSFEEARDLLETQFYDLAILDIMGVRGFQLLDIANEKGIMAIMLTAHALTIESTMESYKRGAAFFVPKEETVNIPAFLSDILKEVQKGENPWSNWLNWLGAYYEKKFGPNWKDEDREFWEALSKKNWRLAAALRKEEKNE